MDSTPSPEQLSLIFPDGLPPAPGPEDAPDLAVVGEIWVAVNNRAPATEAVGSWAKTMIECGYEVSVTVATDESGAKFLRGVAF